MPLLLLVGAGTLWLQIPGVLGLRAREGSGARVLRGGLPAAAGHFRLHSDGAADGAVVRVDGDLQKGLGLRPLRALSLHAGPGQHPNDDAEQNQRRLAR